MEGYVEVYILFDQSKGTFNNDKFMEELFINYFSIKFVVLAQLTLFFLFYPPFLLSFCLSFSLESQSTDDQDKCLKVLYQEVETLFHKTRRYVS